MSVPAIDVMSASEDEGMSLPAWIYRDPEFFELEKDLIPEGRLPCAPGRGWSFYRHER